MMDRRTEAPVPVVPAGRGAVEALHRDRSLLAGRRFHFIGIGGVGMSALAELLLRQGAQVSGSDARVSARLEQLIGARARIGVGHAVENLPADVETVVVSAAVRPDNPELLEARRRKIRVLKYAQMLGELFNRAQGIAVSGTHGKSTTSGWLGWLLREAGLDASFIVGAGCRQLGGSSGIGTGPWFVAEACEFDRSFLNLQPRVACVLNIERDHLDYYRDEDDIVSAFAAFAAQVKPGGLVVANGDDRNVRRALASLAAGGPRRVFFGCGGDNDLRADRLCLRDGRYHFDLVCRGRCLGATHVALAGRHSVLNALAVAAAALEVGLEPATVLALLPGFEGVDRRMTVRGTWGGVTVVDDYAHHPTEIRVTLQALRERLAPRRLWCVFQPHQHSRTLFLLDEFVESLKLADVTVVPAIYAVRDTDENRRAVQATTVVQRLRSQGYDSRYVDGVEAICEVLVENVAPGDVVVTMGAGDVWKVADEFIQRIGVHC